MEARLVFVHGVEYYLHGGEIEEVRLTDLSCFPPDAETQTRLVEVKPNFEVT